MSRTLTQLLLLSTATVVIYFVLMRPRELRRLGRGVRLIGLVYVAAIVISAVLHLTVGWGT